MVNKLILIGHLGKQPELSDVSGGTSLCRFSIATNHRYKDANGQKKEKTEWHNCIMFGKMADIAAQYATKGTKIYIEGRIETNNYTNDNGEKKHYKNVVVNNFQLLDGKKENTYKEVPENTVDVYEKKQSDMGYEDDIPF